MCGVLKDINRKAASKPSMTMERQFPLVGENFFVLTIALDLAHKDS